MSSAITTRRRSTGGIVQIALLGGAKATVNVGKLMVKRLTHTGSTLRPRSNADKDLAATGARLPIVAIGPQTAAEAREHGLDVVAVADSHDLQGLLDVVSSL